MKIGEKILKLRHEKKLSQEQLSNIIGVTRQTISNWELNETTPDANQLIIISKELNMSIDELVDNDISNLIIKKVTNTEKTVNKNLKINKRLGIIIYFIIIIILISLTIYFLKKQDWTNKYQMEFHCQMENINYNISVDLETPNNAYIIVTENNQEAMKDFNRYPAGSSINEIIESLNAVKKIIINLGGSCS